MSLFVWVFLGWFVSWGGLGALGMVLDNVVLPSGMQSLTFGSDFDQSLDKTALPSGLQGLTFGHYFNRSLDNTALPSGLQSLTLGDGFDQSLDKTVPNGWISFH